MPRTALPPDAYAALCGSTVVRVADLAGLGLVRSTIARRCRTGGPWRRMLPGVVKLNNGPPTRAERRLAALLYTGDQALLTGADALELHGMERMPRPSGPVHLLVPEDCRRAGAGRVLAERTHRLPEPEPGRWPMAPLDRAVLDHVRRLTDKTVTRAVLSEVVQRGRCTPAQLGAELEAGCQWGTAVPRAVLREVSAGVRSAAEAAARALLRRSGLPVPQWNVALYDGSGRFLAIPDAWFDEVALAWEIDSKEWHLSPQSYERTIERRAAMTAAQVIVLPTLPGKLVRRPDVLRDLHGAYALAASRPRPPVVAVPLSDRHERHFHPLLVDGSAVRSAS